VITVFKLAYNFIVFILNNIQGIEYFIILEYFTVKRRVKAKRD